jgi:hypothetical protein
MVHKSNFVDVIPLMKIESMVFVWDLNWKVHDVNYGIL